MKTFIFGHKNPDTDSVTAAVSLSYLKNQLGEDTEPRVLGEINKESKFVLDRFNIEHPKFLSNVKVQLSDVPYDKTLMVDENSSIYEAYTYMVKNSITGLPVVKNKKKFFGYVSLKEIAADFIRGDFDLLNASYNNILNVIEGSEVLRFDEHIEGHIMAITFSIEAIMESININENTIAILGSRKEVVDYCINNKVKLIILVGGQKLSDEQIELARKNKVNIISTKKFSFEVSKIVGLSNYIKCIVRNETPVVFTPNDYLTDFYEISNKLKHTNYPMVDKMGNCEGMLRLIDVNSYEKKKVILVDHNEVKQSVDGLNEADILEIVDHHAIGNVTTAVPISCRTTILGSTNSLIYTLFKEANVEIPADIAGVMLSGILSDTLILKSPTTTDLDRKIAEELAGLAGLDFEKYGMEMLKAGSSLEGMSVQDVLFSDYKEFETNGMTFGIGQVITLDYEAVLNNMEEYVKGLDLACSNKGLKLACLFVTDIVSNGSYVLYSSEAGKVMSLAYGKDDMKQGYYLQDVISRKKQMVPNIMTELDNMG